MKNRFILVFVSLFLPILSKGQILIDAWCNAPGYANINLTFGTPPYIVQGLPYPFTAPTNGLYEVYSYTSTQLMIIDATGDTAYHSLNFQHVTATTPVFRINEVKFTDKDSSNGCISFGIYPPVNSQTDYI